MLIGAVSGPAIADDTVGVDDVLRAFRSREQLLSSASARFSAAYSTTGKVLWEGEWTYQSGKVLLDGNILTRSEEGAEQLRHEVYAYDGKVLRTFRDDTIRKAGSVREVGFDLGARLTPERLLGFGLDANGRHTLVDVLEENGGFTIIPDTGQGAEASVQIEFVAPMWGHETSEKLVSQPGLIKMWLDPSRDFLPMRIESYFDAEGQQLIAVIDAIEAQLFDGIWLPVQGRLTPYGRKSETTNGMTMEELENYAVQHGVDEAKRFYREFDYPRTGEANTIVVSGWKIQPKIADEVFVFAFPEHTGVWDSILQRSYVIGKITDSRGNDLVEAMYQDANRSPAPKEEANESAAVTDAAVTTSNVTPLARRRLFYAGVFIVSLGALLGVISLLRSRPRS